MTNPVTRHIAVTASAAATLPAETGGRAALGLARGDSTLTQIGLHHQPVAEFERDLRTLQGLLRGEDVQLNGTRCAIRWLAGADLPKVPVHVAATGPRTIEAAARHAEGVELTVGAGLDRLGWAAQADYVRDRLAEIAALGIERLIIVPGSLDADPSALQASNDRFASDVLPRLAGYGTDCVCCGGGAPMSPRRPGACWVSSLAAESARDRLRLALAAVRAAGPGVLRPPPIPPIEALVAGRRHSLPRDHATVRHHYDVSNEFYALVLGPSMVYSCAYFASPEEALERAQERKLDLIYRKLQLAPGERLLDIGCGWGSLLLHAAARYGVHALGITLSEAQAQLGRRTTR